MHTRRRSPSPKRVLRVALGGVLTALITGGCADEPPCRNLGGVDTCAPAGASGSSPRLVGISHQTLVIGETFEVYGHDLQGLGEARIHFLGRFERDDGTSAPVDLRIAAVYGGSERSAGAAGEIETHVMTWPRFGPFANPFTGDASVGRFVGQIGLEAAREDGLVTRTKGLSVEVGVGPSLVIEAFEPLDADCSAPALRALAGTPYMLRVRPTGIKATRFVYDLAHVNGVDGLTRFEHVFDTPPGSDELGIDELILFNPVSLEHRSYITTLRAVAYDDAGNTVETVLPLSVHRPLEVVYDGTHELAERYAPEPVSGCIPGSIDTTVEYRESRSETRQQSVSVTLSTSWLRSDGRSTSRETMDGISAGESRSRSTQFSEWEGENAEEGYGVSYSRSDANEVGFSSTDGETWSWNMSEGESNESYESRMNSLFGEGSVSGTVGVTGEGSIPGFAKVSGSVETTVGVTAGARTSGTTGNRQRTSTNRGFSAGSSTSEGRSFGSTVAETRGQSLNGTYALGRSRTRTEGEDERLSQTRTWSLSEGTRVDEVVSVGEAEAVDQTWVSSETITSSQGLSGFIPRNKVGIFYRQTTRWVRRAEVRSYDLCGLASHVGELQFNEWTWAPDLAIGASCDSIPPAPSLPPARCFISPCGG